jgi:hypothetical protein
MYVYYCNGAQAHFWQLILLQALNEWVTRGKKTWQKHTDSLSSAASSI